MFQSSFELTGYITQQLMSMTWKSITPFQSSFELTGYITFSSSLRSNHKHRFKALSSLQVI